MPTIHTIHKHIAGLAGMQQNDSYVVILETFMKTRTNLPSVQERIELLEKVNLCWEANGKKPVQDPWLRKCLKKM